MPDKNPEASAVEAADAIVAVDGDTGLEGQQATDAYLETVRPGLPADQDQQPAQADDTAAEQKLYLGKYKTVEALEEATRHFQSEADRMRPEAELARKYPSFLAALEDEAFKEHTMAYFDGPGEPADEPGKPSAPAPLTEAQVRQVVADERAQQSQEQEYADQIKTLTETEKLSQDDLAAFLERTKTRSFTLQDFWRLDNMDKEVAAATAGGQKDALEQVRVAGAQPPSVGAAPGAAPTAKTTVEQMADEIVGAGTSRESEVARDLGL